MKVGGWLKRQQLLLADASISTTSIERDVYFSSLRGRNLEISSVDSVRDVVYFGSHVERNLCPFWSIVRMDAQDAQLLPSILVPLLKKKLVTDSITKQIGILVWIQPGRGIRHVLWACSLILSIPLSSHYVDGHLFW